MHYLPSANFILTAPRTRVLNPTACLCFSSADILSHAKTNSLCSYLLLFHLFPHLPLPLPLSSLPPQMGLSPSRMPQAQGMMAGHGGGNMVGQTANQGQFLPQTQFPPGPAVAATGAMNVTVGPGMGQAPAQAPVTQVRLRDEPELRKFASNS